MADERPGPLSTLRVVEIASEYGAFAGRQFADLGATVILVEPPDGHWTRSIGPVAEGASPGASGLWWWYYHAGKLGTALDLEDPAGRYALEELIGGADVVLEAEPVGFLDEHGLGWDVMGARYPGLTWVSITPFGRHDPLSRLPFSDLSVMAGGGPAWSCGYDDHSLPPVRPGSSHSVHIAGLWAVNGALVSLLARKRLGRGQLVDLSLHAAANVTTESATTRWLIAGEIVQRQTCRHASVVPTASTLVTARDGRHVTTGVPPRDGIGCQRIRNWLAQEGLLDELPDAVFLSLGAEMGAIAAPEQSDDVLTQAIMVAMRDALRLLATKLTAMDYFLGAQRRGIASAAILAPEEALDSEQLVSRHYRQSVDHGNGVSYSYPRPPGTSEQAPWRIARRAPNLGEHQDQCGRGARAGADERLAP
jgi:crotonobetainyl-CoA:carnitine CoA-transferase CaiB-like acyl-CoA transferase